MNITHRGDKMDKKIGFIGCGNMGKAILGGMIASGRVLLDKSGFTPLPPIKSLHCTTSTVLMRRSLRKRSRKSLTSFLGP